MYAVFLVLHVAVGWVVAATSDALVAPTPVGQMGRRVCCALRCCWSCRAAEKLCDERLLHFLLLICIYRLCLVGGVGLRGFLFNKGVWRSYGAQRPEKRRLGPLLRFSVQRPGRAKPCSGFSRTHMCST